ncbi:hypothetical protein NECID01_1452, partial [Nematocida sp. AWRm77]
LDLDGWLQTSSTVQEIVKHLPHLRELTIECERLDSAAAESFKACKKLERLEMGGVYQSSRTVQEIAKHLPSLNELIIRIDTLDFSLADALRNSSALRSLNLSVSMYTPGFLARYLQSPLPKLTSLELCNYDSFSSGNKEDREAVQNAKEKGIYIDLNSTHI